MDVFNPFKTPNWSKERVKKKFTAQEREQSATSISCQYDDEPKANNTNSPYIKILQILT